MSEHRRPSGPQVDSEIARLVVERARKRMLEASARSIAVKWRSTRRGDRPAALKVTVRERPPPA